MKNNMIALLLSIVMTVGSISGTPVFAVETTAEEAVAVEEETVEKATAVSEETDDVEVPETTEEETVTVEEGTVGSEEAPAETEEAVTDDTSKETSKEESAVTEEEAIESEAKEAALAEGDVVDSGSCSGNVTWTLMGTESDLTLTISGRGEKSYYGWESYDDIPWYSKRDRIKTIVVENGVISLGGYAFYGCFNATNVMIPDSVTSIGDYAFNGCSSLTSITIPNGVPSIGDYAFQGCSSLTSITIPNGVPSIGKFAFHGCSSLTSITIPDSVTSIGDNAFASCNSLTSITIPDSVTKIGKLAFDNCSSLTSITIPDSVTSIRDKAFWGCSSLTSITIPDSVTSIGYNAFQKCSSLTSMTIPDSVTSIGDDAFWGCSSLTSITIPDSVTRIGDYAFRDCTSLTSITIPNADIVEGMFYGCNNLTNITILDGVTYIGSYAFQGCSNLTSVTISNSVRSIWNYAFASCNSLTSITIPNGVTSIRNHAFEDCSNLTSITLPDSLTYIGSYAFQGCSSLTSITIPNGVLSIGEGMLAGCNSLTSITIPNGVLSIGEGMLAGCNSLTSVTIPNSVTSIGNRAFSNCHSLTSITIPNSVTSIGDYAFWDCNSLTSITIPDSVTSIGKKAFYSCDNLKQIYFKGNAPIFNGFYIFEEVTATAYYPYDDTTWTEDKKQNYGGEITWISYELETTGSIELDPEFTCNIGELIQISATYTGDTEITSATVSADPDDALEFSEVSILGPVDNGNGQEMIISFMVTANKGGDYNLTLTASDGTSATTVLKVVDKYDIADAEVVIFGASYTDENGIKCFTYTGNPLEPVHTVRLSNKPVAEIGKDITLTYEDNTEIGTARCILEGIGDYHGQKTVEFLIVPNSPEYESVESEFPGSCTVVVNKISQSAAYKLDIQKDGNSIEGYPKEIEDISTSDGSSATDSFTEYADHLEEGETYTIRVCAIVKIGGKDYQSAWAEGEVKTLLTSFKTRYPYILAAGKMECYLEFPTSGEREIEFTGKGAIRVKDEFGEDVFVINEPLSDYNFGSDDSDSDAMIENGVIHISLNMNQPARALSPTPQKNKLLPGHHYYITIDPSTIGVGNNHDYSGSQEKDKWTFETMNFEIPAYINDSYTIPGQYMDRLYKPDHANTLKAMDPNPGRGGICYGFCAAALAWNKGYPRLKSLKESKSIDHLGNMPMEYTENPNPADNTLFNYIVLQHLVQLSDDRVTIKNEHVNDIDTILRKVKAGEYFLLDLNAGEGNNRAGHTVIPLGYKEDTDGTVHLYCYNCEYEKSKCFVDELTIRKVNGKLSYWYWSDKLNAGINNHAISWTDFDQSYDDLTQIQKGNLAYTNITLTTNPQAIEINGTRAATEASEDQNGFDRYYYWYKDNVMEVSSVEDSPLILSLSDGYINYSGTVNGGTVFISLEDDCVRLTPNNEGEECSFTIQNWEDYDESTKIKVTAGGSEQTTLKQTDDGWTLEGAEPGTITITMESGSVEDGEEITNTEEITVESTTGSVEMENDSDQTLHVYEDADGNGSMDTEIGTVAMPHRPGITSIENASISGIEDKEYTGNALTQEPVVTVRGKTLESGTNYTVSYENNINVGTAKVIINGIGKYTGTIEKEFEIAAKEVTPTVTLSKLSFTYNGKAQKPVITVKDGDATLVGETDYTVSYENNINVGTASVTIACIGNYTGSVTKTFTIKKAPNTITAKSFTRTYSTKAQTFSLGVKIKNGTPTYKSNSKSVTVSKAGKVTVKAKFIGKATITITAPEKTNYSKQTKKITITVNPTKTALSSVTSPSAGKMTVKWKKNAVGTGYQIQYSTSSKFTSPKAVSVTKNSTLTKTIGSLAKGKKYYVRIRTYKTVGNTKFYSAWSAAKAVTIRK